MPWGSMYVYAVSRRVTPMMEMPCAGTDCVPLMLNNTCDRDTYTHNTTFSTHRFPFPHSSAHNSPSRWWPHIESWARVHQCHSPTGTAAASYCCKTTHPGSPAPQTHSQCKILGAHTHKIHILHQSHSDAKVRHTQDQTTATNTNRKREGRTVTAAGAPAALEAPLCERVRVCGRVISANLIHPRRPVARPPRLQNRTHRLSIGRVGEDALVRYQAGGQKVRERTCVCVSGTNDKKRTKRDRQTIFTDISTRSRYRESKSRTPIYTRMQTHSYVYKHILTHTHKAFTSASGVIATPEARLRCENLTRPPNAQLVPLELSTCVPKRLLRIHLQVQRHSKICTRTEHAYQLVYHRHHDQNTHKNTRVENTPRCQDWLAVWAPATGCHSLKGPVRTPAPLTRHTYTHFDSLPDTTNMLHIHTIRCPSHRQTHTYTHKRETHG